MRLQDAKGLGGTQLLCKGEFVNYVEGLIKGFEDGRGDKGFEDEPTAYAKTADGLITKSKWEISFLASSCVRGMLSEILNRLGLTL
jgi:hypothetical protein